MPQITRLVKSRATARPPAYRSGANQTTQRAHAAVRVALPWGSSVREHGTTSITDSTVVLGAGLVRDPILIT
jgi:hypothetical protein